MIAQVFIVGLVFSFVGSIPPGTLNILVLQLALENKVRTALRFALAVAMVEYLYAWIAVVFENWLTSSPAIAENFQLTGALVMIAIGVMNLWSARKPSTFSVKFQQSGFRRGFVLSVLNPQAIPFWIAVTAYLKVEGWIDLTSGWLIHSYVFGTSVGVMILLTILAVMSQKVSGVFQQSKLIRMIPGAVLLVLGTVGLIRYFSS
ncbi:MAG: LysE family transporter [Cyclobacteriaceae bacterium]